MANLSPCGHEGLLGRRVPWGEVELGVVGQIRTALLTLKRRWQLCLLPRLHVLTDNLLQCDGCDFQQIPG